MATLFIPNHDELHKIIPSNSKEYFSIVDIGLAVGGPIDITLIADYWIFVNKFGREMNFELNVKATNMFNFPIYGFCVMCDISELPSQFFIPNKDDFEFAKLQIQELLSDLQNMSEEFFNAESSGALIDPQRLLPHELNDITEDIHVMIMEEGYKNLDQMFQNFDNRNEKYLQSFYLFNNGTIKIDMPPIKEKRIHYIDVMLAYFSVKEEYEKCAKLKKIRKYFEDYCC